MWPYLQKWLWFFTISRLRNSCGWSHWWKAWFAVSCPQSTQPKGRGWQVCTNSRTAVCLFPSTTPNDVPDSVTTSEVAMNFYEASYRLKAYGWRKRPRESGNLRFDTASLAKWMQECKDVQSLTSKWLRGSERAILSRLSPALLVLHPLSVS